jgi:hypothetical protein
MDLTDFKKKMTDLDTIKIWFDHSICTYQGAERIEITKKSNLYSNSNNYGFGKLCSLLEHYDTEAWTVINVD